MTSAPEVRSQPAHGDESGLVLEAKGLTATYSGAPALRDADLEVRSGEVVAVLGANGAGKTTLLRTLAGLLKPTRGSVLLQGDDVTRVSTHARAARGLCLVPDSRGIFPRLTVRENLSLHTPVTKAEPDLDRAFERFAVLKKRQHSKAGQLSGGEQQMLALARCFAADPAVVLLDEVSMGLAPRVIDVIFEALDDLVRAGVALVLVEQYVQRAMAIADRVYLVSRGSVTPAGAPADIDEQALLASYLGAPDPAR